jgi:alpha-L-glutamate ligase-like protein
MVEYRVHQHTVFDKIFSNGVADIRIIVYHHIPRIAMVRIPTYKSKGKANLHQGAIGVGIDLGTGVMQEGYDGKSYFIAHPDTKVVFKMTPIPYWKEVLKISTEASKVIPLKYIGIDIVIDNEKGPLVMEINARPGLEIQNVNCQGLRPILEQKK